MFKRKRCKDLFYTKTYFQNVDSKKLLGDYIHLSKDLHDFTMWLTYTLKKWSVPTRTHVKVLKTLWLDRFIPQLGHDSVGIQFADQSKRASLLVNGHDDRICREMLRVNIVREWFIGAEASMAEKYKVFIKNGAVCTINIKNYMY